MNAVARRLSAEVREITPGNISVEVILFFTKVHREIEIVCQMDDGGGDPVVLADNNKGDERKMAAVVANKKSGEAEDDLPNKSQDKLTLGVKEIQLDESGAGQGDNRDQTSEAFDGHDAENMLEKSDSIPNPCHLPVEMWEKILGYVGHEDLKSMRCVCSYMNSVVVPKWTRLIKTSCLIFDGNVQISSVELPEGNEKVASDCDLIQGILQYFRIRNIVTSKCIRINFKWVQLARNVKILELTECDMHWADIMDLLNCFDCLEEFKIYMNPDTTKEHEKKFLSTFLDGLDEGLSLEKTPEWESQNFFASDPIPTLKTVTIHIPFMHCVNTVLRILEYKCNYSLENLSITMDRERMGKSSIDVGEFRIPCRLDVGDLLYKNIQTIKRVSLKLIPEFIAKDGCPVADYYLTSYPATGVLLDFLDVRGLELEEICFDLPIYFFGNAVEDETPNQKRESMMRPFRKFLKDQKKSLKILRLSGFGWYEGADENFKKEIIGDDVDVYMKLVVLGGNTEFNPNWTLLKDKIENLEIRWKGVGQGLTLPSVPAIFKGDTDSEPMEKVHSFSLYNHFITFADFDLPFIVEKFPNLTCLKIINLAKIDYCFSDENGRPQEWIGAPALNFEIHDYPFQLVLKKLRNLHTLHLDCDMKGLTDFGLTGVSDEATARMKRNNTYKIESGDETGYSLAGLKKLTSLKLIGVEGNVVTNASVWLALRKLPLLKELVIIGKQKITETAKTYLKNMMEKRVGFHLEIKKPTKDPSKPEVKEYYVYKRMD